ncbi:MAG TPA: imidazole glycerol phosphate synthase subunit HisH [Candidatus Acidoferrum sp.]|nr:imidazole glycerol phosphate synthase subunit HisH [Candidatus Acidoferrum sp.]
MNLTLIDYGAGNVPSVERALQRLGATAQRANSAECISNAEALLLPGVGHYAALARALDQQNLRSPLLEAIHRGIPFLGICLGLQVLFQSSEEAPELQGLNLLRGRVSTLPSTVKLPHMGWNPLKLKQESRLLNGVSPGAYFYFAHSFAALDLDDSVCASCRHGADFAAVIEHKNICAVQFHPEKSGDAGARVLENFLRMAA